jgi:hypothetical protein
VKPSVMTMTIPGRSGRASARSIPVRMSVPPPPASVTCCADVTRVTACTSASQASRSTPVTSAMAISRSSSPIDPDVSITMATVGSGRRRLGKTTPRSAAERRDGRRYV